MDEPDPQSKPRPATKAAREGRAVDPREARLAKALRDNLRRRKQARQASTTDGAVDQASPLTPLADD